MRDIRGDLQERASLFQQQIDTAQAQHQALLDQLKKEQDSRLKALKDELEAVNRVLEIEHRRVGMAGAAANFQQPQPQQPPSIPPVDLSKLRRAS
jgi:hypothetical protein